MKIERFFPSPPPSFTMTFSHDEGVAIVAALSDYAANHPGASHREQWKQWAKILETELRR